MPIRTLATDYDGTIARHGTVEPDTLAALRRLRDAGCNLILVTGRELPQLKHVFPDLDLCHMVVAENGALLYTPETGKERPLCEPPEEAFVRALKERGVKPLSVGQVIVATYEPHETTVLAGHPRPRAGAAGDLQQGRRDGPAFRGQQGERTDRARSTS